MRKRRTRYTWFPNIGFQGEDEADDLSAFKFTATVPAAAETMGSVSIFDLIPDFSPSEPTATTDNLSDFIGNEYILKRIVGKLFCGCSVSDNQAPKRILFGAGFFVARSDENAPQLPIISGSSGNTNYGPLNNQNIREPWIWRRVWQIQNPSNPIQTGLLNTCLGGSLQDGPHIDSKVSRRIRQDERLFFAVQGYNADDVSQGANSMTLEGVLDYRILGALRKAKNRSAF